MRTASNGHHLPERPQLLGVYTLSVYAEESGILLFSDNVLKLPERLPQVLASASILKVHKIYQILAHCRALRTLQE